MDESINITLIKCTSLHHIQLDGGNGGPIALVDNARLRPCHQTKDTLSIAKISTGIQLIKASNNTLSTSGKQRIGLCEYVRLHSNMPYT